MRTIPLAIFVLLVGGCFGESLRPSALAKNERIMIDYDHDGDRSGYRRVYEITGDAITMRISEYFHWGYGENTRTTPLKKEPVGELSLKRPDVVGLDRLLEFYRLKKTGSGTSRDQITIAYERDGKNIGTEHFIDESGIMSFADMEWAREDNEFLKKISGGIDIELIKALAPLHRFDKYLWKKEANQVPEPTAASGRGSS